jgi:hypothetical protein
MLVIFQMSMIYSFYSKILIIEEEQVEEASAIFELLASEGPYIVGHCQSVL